MSLLMEEDEAEGVTSSSWDNCQGPEQGERLGVGSWVPREVSLLIC